MKYKAKQYASALADIAIKGGEADKIAKRFVEFLKKNGQMNKAREILDLAENLFIKKTGRRKVILETARKIKLKQKGLIDSALQKGDFVEEKINPELLAGIKIIVNDEQLDLSMQSKINKLFL